MNANEHEDLVFREVLGRPEKANPSLLWHLDSGFPQGPFDGCLLLRGWCAAESDPVKEVRFEIPRVMTWPGTYGLPRPDVPAALPRCPTADCGFEICLKLPPGTYHGQIRVELMTGLVTMLTDSHLRVSRRKRISYLFAAKPEKLLRFQMLAGPSHPPRRLERFPQKAFRTRTPTGQCPSFSIVTPSFNQSPFLEETLRSVLSQPQVFLHYVVQDGGSTDGSAAIIARVVDDLSAGRHKSSRILSDDLTHGSNPVGPAPAEASSVQMEWESCPDESQTDAIKKGFAKTHGRPEDLMAWINSDDFYLPGAFAYVAKYFAENPTVDVVYGHRILVDAKSREIGRWYLPAHDDRVLQLYDFIPQETLFWRRRIWDRVGGLDTQFKFAMDWDLLLRFTHAHARIKRLPQFLACFRVHQLQKTSSCIHTFGQQEIDALRARANGRRIPSAELERHPALSSYLRRSAMMEFCPRDGITLGSRLRTWFVGNRQGSRPHGEGHTV